MEVRWNTRIVALLGALALSGASLAIEPPAVTDEAPAAGKRVRIAATGYENSQAYHTLYLPTDWQPGTKYPVIIEYAPNGWAPNPEETVNGSVEDTKMGFFQSGGEGFIWATMPMIQVVNSPNDPATHNSPNWWWGSGEDDVADYTKAGLIDILEDYGGDPASVFVTGFSRGAIAAGQIGLRDQLVDTWLGFLPHSHHYQLSSLNAPQSYPLLDRIDGRASFITAGEQWPDHDDDGVADGGYGSSIVGRNLLTDPRIDFPVEFRELVGENHTFNWLEDDASATSLAVRQEVRDWLADTITNRPGTSSVSGTVTDSLGVPVKNVRIQSGDTHWTFTDMNGNYELPSLIDSERTLDATYPGFEFVNPSLPITINGVDLIDQDFMLTTPDGPPPGDLNGDGHVGPGDVSILMSFWGQSVTPGDLLSGDPSGDGFVGGADFDFVRKYWGIGTPPGASFKDVASIPEPGTLSALTLSGLALFVLRQQFN